MQPSSGKFDMAFHGSYMREDVEFLLKPINMPTIEIEEKEQLLLSGAKHYSELISPECPPPPEYEALFQQAMDHHRLRIASDVVKLARHLATHINGQIVLVSLARAGTPIGILLRRTLAQLGRTCVHYSVSIIRDRGIDEIALLSILSQHEAREVVFVDGWTGKGTIAHELAAAVTRFNTQHHTHLDGSLYVLTDLVGVAKFAASHEDRLLPSSILNATVSGLISRTILNSQYVGEHDFHACLYFHHLERYDRSRWFVDQLSCEISVVLKSGIEFNNDDWSPERRNHLRQTSKHFIEEVSHRYQVTSVNRIKPGIGETTRALLRRLPTQVLIQDPNHNDTQPILWLATERKVSVAIESNMPYKATAIL